MGKRVILPSYTCQSFDRAICWPPKTECNKKKNEINYLHRTITLQPLTILLPLVVGIKIYTYIFYFISFKLSGVGIKKYKLNSCGPKFIFLSSRNFKQTGHVVSSRRPLRHLGGARGLMGSCSVFTLKSPCLFRPKRDNQSWMGNERPSTGSFWLLTEYNLG